MFVKQNGSNTSGVQRTFVDKSGSPLECTYCHGKNHTKDKCYKLIGYPSDHPYNPNNRGKKRVFTKPGQTSSSYKSGNAVQASEESCSSGSTVGNAVGSTPPNNWHSQMEALQNQMTSLMQCFNQGQSKN